MALKNLQTLVEAAWEDRSLLDNKEYFEAIQ